MAFVLGQQGTGWTVATGNDFAFSGGAMYYHAGYLCAANATMNAFHFSMNTGSGGNNTKGSVYLGAGPGATLVATSSLISSATGDVSAAISGSLIAGQTYTLVIQPSTANLTTWYNTGSSAFALGQNNSTNYPYASPPGTLPATDAGTGHEFICWIDGTATGGGASNQKMTMLGIGS